MLRRGVWVGRKTVLSTLPYTPSLTHFTSLNTTGRHPPLYTLILLNSFSRIIRDVCRGGRARPKYK